MKKIVLIFIFFTQILDGFCQKYGSIEGMIYDSIDNGGVAYVNIELIKANIETYTDMEGRFIINNIPIGEDILECSLVGYGKPRRLNIRIFEDSTVFIKINLAKCEYDMFGRGDCPVCNKSDEIIPIVYGEPTKKALRQARNGKIWLGGCLITHCDPHWYCKRDKVRF